MSDSPVAPLDPWQDVYNDLAAVAVQFIPPAYCRIEPIVRRIKELRATERQPHRKWIETDDPDVVACMGSVPACAENGCQHRKVDAQLAAKDAELLALRSAYEELRQA